MGCLSIPFAFPTLTLAGEPADAKLPVGIAAPAVNPLDPALKQPTCSGDELKRSIRAVLAKATRVQGLPEEKLVRELVSLHQDLDRDATLSDAARQPLRRTLRVQLRRFGEAIRQQPAAAVAAKLPSRQEGVLGQQLGFGQQQPQAQANNPPADYGKDLVELIEAVIAPTTWDTVGGNGAIRYWAPGHALVVRQTGEVHEALGQLLQDLR
jgi:hypothetical protein